MSRATPHPSPGAGLATVAGIPWPDADHNSVVPRQLFIDPDLYELEMERIFRGPTWHLLCHESEIPQAGDFKRSDIGGVPIFVVRGKDGLVRSFINACAHRGTEVVNLACGNASGGVLRCIYHQWTYDLEGRLVGVALPNEFPDEFSKSAHGLTPVRVERMNGCVFATLSDETPSLGDYLGDTIVERLTDALGEGNLTYLGSQSVTYRANWKLCLENQFDSYHAPVLHAAARMLKTKAAPGSRFDIARTFDGAYAHAWTKYQSLPIAEENKTALNDYSLFEVKGREEPHYNYVIGMFPGDIVCHQLDVIQLRYSHPRGPDATDIEYAHFGFADDDEALSQHRVRQAHLLGPEGVINLEDACALERVQWSASAGGDNKVLKGAIPGRPPYGYAEEGGIREMYASYRSLMAAGEQ